MNQYLKKPLTAVFIFLSAFMLYSCSPTNEISFSESTPTKTRAKLIQQKIEMSSDYDYQTFDLLGKTTAIFLVNNSQKVPDSVVNKLEQSFTAQLRKSNLYEAITPAVEVNKRLSKHGKIKQLSKIYLDTLTNVSISDKDISNPMAEYLNVENFIILQIDNWPCSECLLQDRIRIKVKIVNGKDSDILWTGTDEIYVIDTQADRFPEMTELLVADLFQNFYSHFKVKWHKKRYLQLAKLK